MASDASLPIDTDGAVAATADLIDDAARDRLVVSGADAATYLQSQLSQEVRDLAVGAARWTFVLDPTGKVEVLARLRRTGDDAFELDTDAGFGEAMEARVRRFMIRVDVEVERHDAQQAEPAPETETRRVAAGWPRLGAEIVPGETIPATTGVVTLAVSFTKGCYPGQELVERMDSRGADAPRRLRVIDVAAGTAVGDPVRADDSDGNDDSDDSDGDDGPGRHGGGDVGVITSVSPAGDLAIASVKRGVEVGRPPVHLGG